MAKGRIEVKADEPFWGFFKLNMRQGKEEKRMRLALSGWSPSTILRTPEVIEAWRELNDPYNLGLQPPYSDRKGGRKWKAQKPIKKAPVLPWEGF